MLDERQILNIVSTELSQAVGGNSNDFIEADRKDALSMYLGRKDGREVNGKSQVVSTDVADAIEWIMPELMKSFTQNNEVVTFDPQFEGDEDMAKMESQFVYDILMKHNDGFTILHQFFKDALLQKNGFLKVFYEKCDDIEIDKYTGLDEAGLNVLMSNPSVNIVEQTIEETPMGPVFDVTVERVKTSGKINVIPVPPEEFRVNQMHNSVNLKTARFCAHVFLKTVTDLIEDGYDRDLVESVDTANNISHDRDYRFYQQGESVYPDDSINLDKSMRLIEVAECFIHMDINGDGVAEYLKITVAGGDEPSTILDIEEIDENPFISATCILMSHKLFGLSIYDRLKQIQEQKTSLWRNILDNMYLQNNQRTVILENQVNIDDLLVSRPGGIIRAKTANAVMPLQTNPLSSDSYKMMDYLDKVRMSRAGVSPESPIQDTLIGDRVGSDGIERMLTQREELVGLMIRVLAEVALKPLCYKIRDLARTHLDTVFSYNYNGKWIKVNPAQWAQRTTSTVRVGTGSGNTKAVQAAMAQLLSVQEKVLSNPNQSLVTENQIFALLDDFAKLAGLSGVGRYFMNPASPEGQQFKRFVTQNQEQMQQMQTQHEQQMLAAQMKLAQSQEDKVKVDLMNAQLKNQNEATKTQLSMVEKEATHKISMLEQQLEEYKLLEQKRGKDNELNFRYWEANERFKLERERLDEQRRSISSPSSDREGE